MNTDASRGRASTRINFIPPLLSQDGRIRHLFRNIGSGINLPPVLVIAHVSSKILERPKAHAWVPRDTGGEFPVGSYRMDTSPKNSDSSAPERSDSSAAPIAVDEETVEQRDERFTRRSEEHTSELQSRFDLVCRLLLDKNKGDTDLS